MQPAISPNSAAPARKVRKVALAVGGGLLLALCAGGVAVASAHAHGGFKQHVTQQIDAALDAVDATPAQRDAIHAARDHAFTTVEAHRAAAQSQLESLLALWVPDNFDPTQSGGGYGTQALAQAQQTSDAVVQALSDAHDALTTAQRQKLGAYLRAHKPSGHHAGPPPFAKRMLASRVDNLLDKIKASTDQRDKVHATVDKLMASLHGGDHAADFDQAVTLFTADTLDRAQLAALQAKHVGQAQAMSGAIRAALVDLHGTLDAGQRQQVADFIRAHHHGG